MSEKQKQFISAIAYVYNGEHHIKNFLEMVYTTLNQYFEKFEIICVNDYSDDNSKQVIHDVSCTMPNCMVSIVNTGFYQGIEAAMLAGLDLAIGDFVLEFDEIIIDYDSKIIMQCYNRCVEGFDVVSCGSGNRRRTSKLFYSLYNRHSGSQHALRSETFRIISRRGINRVYAMSPNPMYRKALYQNCGLKTDYLEYEGVGISNRKHTLKQPHETALTSLILFTNIAYKSTVTLAFVMMLATLGSIIYTITVYIAGNPIEGFTTMMALLSGAFFALFTILAVVIKYLTVILKLVFQKQRYTLESIEKLT